MRVRPVWIAVVCMVALAGCGSSGKPSASAGSNGYTSFLHFSQCMRTHGVPNFPDPSPSGGGIHIDIGSGLDPLSPAFESAQQTCKHLLPGGGPPSVVPESQKLALLKNAECMRTHGVPNYPDPVFPRGGGIEQLIAPDINPSSPAFQQAAKACGGP